MGLFTRAQRPAVKQLEMILDHDGREWIASNDSHRISAESLDELDLRIEKALADELDEQGNLEVFMCSNNEVIPMWMRPYMNHYFNRVLELPLRYRI